MKYYIKYRVLGPFLFDWHPVENGEMFDPEKCTDGKFLMALSFWKVWERLTRVQGNYEQQENQQQGNSKACHARDVLNGRLQSTIPGKWGHLSGLSRNAFCNNARLGMGN